jgi:hemerythrin superfamily protein
MNAIDFLKADHKNVKKLFKTFEQVPAEDYSRKEILFEQIHDMLESHSDLESELFYPAVLEVPGKEAEDAVLEAREEHKIVRELLKELEEIAPGDPTFDAKMKVLRETVEHHADEEEDDMFPVARKLGRERLEQLAESMAAVRKLKGRAA